MKFLILILVSFTIISCARINPEVRKETAHEIAMQHQFRTHQIEAGEFTLVSFMKPLVGNEQNTGLLHIYIEGDGLAFRRKNRISEDPTPITPVALQLAVKDEASQVVYFGRPCQFLNKSQLEKCPNIYWSSHRYAEEVIAAYQIAIDELMAIYGNRRLVLHGYSGGGVIAMLLAARRQDVEKVITIAANLDHKAWTDHHNVSALGGSLNPVDDQVALSQVSQTHFCGEQDKIVPCRLSRDFIDSINKPDRDNINRGARF